jgi:transposase
MSIKYSNKTPKQKPSINLDFREKYINNKPYTGLIKVLLNLNKGYHEDRNRQRKNRNRKPNRERRQDLWSEEICRASSKSRCLRKSSKTRQIKLDQGKRELPRVMEFDRMSIKPRMKIENEGNKGFHQAENTFSDRLLDERARILLSKEGAIKWIDKGLFSVQSQSGVGRYRVEWNGSKWICKCPYFTKNNKDCKHIIAVQYYLQGYITIHGEKPEEKRISYSQDWAAYNHAQIEEYDLFNHLLHELVSTVNVQEQHMGRPRLNLRDLIFCSILKTYSKKSSRTAHHLYNEAFRKQYISYSPHANAIPKTLLRPEITPILYDLVHLTALPFADIDNNFAVDSSGFSCSSFGAYCEHAHGTKRMHNWLKVHICTGIRSNIISDVIITDEYQADSPQFKKLLLNTSKFFNINEVSADLAYSSRKNLEIVDKLGGTPYIPFKKNATGKARGSALWNKTFHYFQLHREEFDNYYHKRSNAEATFHAIKRKLGENLQSKNRVAQENEMLCKIISYNITVLIRSMVKMGITPDFFTSVGVKNIVSAKIN